MYTGSILNNNRYEETILFAIPVSYTHLDVYKRQKQGYYHPRISAQYTYSYRALSDGERWAYDKMYNDFFYHRHNEFWKQEAMRKLPPLISSTRMLVCGEDLGMIPHCVPEVMKTLQILSLEIQRMPKYPEYEFGDIWHYPYLSVCTTSKMCIRDRPGTE